MPIINAYAKELLYYYFWLFIVRRNQSVEISYVHNLPSVLQISITEAPATGSEQKWKKHR